MKTHFIGQEEVSAYALDLASKLVKLGSAFPQKWIYVGGSGKLIADELYAQLPKLEAELVSTLGSLYDRRSDAFTFLGDVGPGDFSPGETVLLLDSAIHTGASLTSGLKALATMGVHNVLTYSLVVKRSAELIPTYFGVLIDNWDRALFQLDAIPNNRLAESPPFGTLRKLNKDHVESPFGELPAPFEGLCGGDLLYNDQSYGMQTYVYELESRIVGFVSFAKRQSTMFIDAWATCSDYQTRGIGAATLRWAETWARASGCQSVELWAYEPAIPIYERFNYAVVAGRVMDLGEGRRYQMMTKHIMHHGDRGY